MGLKVGLVKKNPPINPVYGSSLSIFRDNFLLFRTKHSKYVPLHPCGEEISESYAKI